MTQSTALASLTAIYTDSEGEEEEESNENAGEGTLTSTQVTPENRVSPASVASPVQVKITSKYTNLVSYQDDTVVSDDEGEVDDSTKNQEVIILPDTETLNESEVEKVEGDDIQLPPEPPGHCSTELQEKITKLYEKMQGNDLDMNAVIQLRKDFRNPSIYEKLIQFCGINELGTNYPPSIYDPLKWSKESYYEELAKVQKSEMEKKEKERKSKVEVVSGTKKQEEDAKKRKSKWDQPGGNTVTTATIKPAGLVQPSLTTSATGTKATVISAFGSLPKKPRQ